MPLWQTGPQLVELCPPVGDGRVETLDPVFLPHGFLHERQRAEIVLTGMFGGNLGLRQQRADAGQTFVGLGHVVRHVGPRSIGIHPRNLLDRANGLTAARAERLEAGNARRQQIIDLRLGRRDAFEQRQRLRVGLLGTFHMGLGSSHLAGVEQLRCERTIVLTGGDQFIRIRARFGQQPAFGPLGPHLLRNLVDLHDGLGPSIIHRLKFIEPRNRVLETRGDLFQPPTGCDGIGLEALFREFNTASHLGHRSLEAGIRPAPLRQCIDPLRGRGDVRLERRGQFACLFMRLFQRIQRRAALPSHVSQRRPGLGRIEEFDRFLGLGGAEEGLFADPFLRLFPHIHQPQPALAIPAQCRLHVVVGRPREALHGRLEVGVAVGQHPMPLLLAVEQIGKCHHLALEGGELLPCLCEPPLVPGTLHEKRRHGSQARERRQPQRQRAGAKHACRLSLCAFLLCLVLHPTLGRADKISQTFVVLSVFGPGHEHLVDQFLPDGLRIETARHLEPPGCLHGDLPVLDVEHDRHIAGGIERGRSAVALAALCRLLLPPLDQALEQLRRRIAIPSGISHHDHAIVPAALELRLVDRRPHLFKRVLHSRDEHPLGVGRRGLGRRNLRMGGKARQQREQGRPHHEGTPGARAGKIDLHDGSRARRKSSTIARFYGHSGADSISRLLPPARRHVPRRRRPQSPLPRCRHPPETACCGWSRPARSRERRCVARPRRVILLHRHRHPTHRA